MKRTLLGWVGVCCLVSTITAGGVVSTPALFGLVVPVALLVFLVAATSSRHPLRGAVVVPAVALASSEAVNILSGDYQGPVARVAVVSATLTGLALLLAFSRWPATFLLPVAGITAWNDVLGGAGHSRLVSVVLVVLGAGALLVVEQERRNLNVRPPRAVALAVLAILATTSTGAVVLQSRQDGRAPARPLAVARVKQGSLLPDPFPRQVGAFRPNEPLPAPSRTSAPKVPLAERSISFARPLALSFGAFLAALLIVAVLRLLWVRSRWRRFRRRLRATRPQDGAWLWLRAQLWMLRRPLPSASSPDVVASATSWPELADLAARASQQAFSQMAEPGDEMLWTMAARVTSIARDEAPATARWLASWRNLPTRAV